MCNKEYYGCHKDQKVFSYWGSEFVDPIYIMKHIQKKSCFYTVKKHCKLWLTLRECGLLSRKRVKPKIKLFVLGICIWQVPMKHAIILLVVFNIDFTSMKCFCNLSCFKKACAWNQRTKKEVIPTQIADLFVRKRLASSENKNVDKMSREEVRMKDLSTFDLRIECHWTILRLESRYKKEVVTKRMADLFVRKKNSLWRSKKERP